MTERSPGRVVKLSGALVSERSLASPLIAIPLGVWSGANGQLWTSLGLLIGGLVSVIGAVKLHRYNIR